VSAQSLFIAGGLLLVLAALAGGGLKVKEIDIPKLAPWARAAAGAAGVSAFTLGVFPGIYSEPTSPAPRSASTSGPAPGSIATGESATGSTSAVTVKILRPLSGGTVKLHDKVRIEASGVRPDQQVWILVAFEGDSKWFPQGPCDKISDGLYECSRRLVTCPRRKELAFPSPQKWSPPVLPLPTSRFTNLVSRPRIPQ
jgi:hypothetical protein